MPQVNWVTYNQLSYTQQKVVQKRYKPPYRGWLYRTYIGQLTQIGTDRRREK